MACQEWPISAGEKSLSETDLSSPNSFTMFPLPNWSSLQSKDSGRNPETASLVVKPAGNCNIIYPGFTLKDLENTDIRNARDGTRY